MPSYSDLARKLRQQPTWLALTCAPLFFGLLSVLLGQDANWDLTNYHLYNAYAVLNDRLKLDLAPAGLQSYFNPLIDLPYYWMITHLPARWVSFLMGCLHGITFWILFGITGRFLGREQWRTRLILSAFGCLGPLFVSELGNTMGDLTTAPFLLGAVWLVLLAAVPGTRPAARLLFAGALVGLAVGLKLSNGPFLVGLAAAVIALPAGKWHDRIRSLTIVFAGWATGFLLTGAYWLLVIWKEFQNPFFPQFNKWFGAKLALPVSIVDKRFMLTGFWDALLLPYTAVLKFIRVTELNIILLLWPVVYSLAIAYLIHRLVRYRQKAGPSLISSVHTTGGGAVLFCFMLFTYLSWMALFGIARYVLVLEILLPLSVYLLLRGLNVRRHFHITCALLVVALVATAAKPHGWGHARFVDANFFVEDPGITDPRRATILVGDSPIAWVIPFLPAAISYIGFGNGFPASPAYLHSAKQKMLARGGSVHMLLTAADYSVRYRLQDAALQADLRSEGLTVNESSCRIHPARIGAMEIGYRLCDVELQR